MGKIRNLHEKDDPNDDEECIKDIIDILIKIVPSALTLEIINDRPAYRAVRDGLKQADYAITALRRKLRYEVLEEIEKDYSGRKPKYKGNTDHFKNGKG